MALHVSRGTECLERTRTTQRRFLSNRVVEKGEKGRHLRKLYTGSRQRQTVTRETKDEGCRGRREGQGMPPWGRVAAAENWRLRRGELGDKGGDTNIGPRWNELLRTRALWQEGSRISGMGGERVREVAWEVEKQQSPAEMWLQNSRGERRKGLTRITGMSTEWCLQVPQIGRYL